MATLIFSNEELNNILKTGKSQKEAGLLIKDKMNKKTKKLNFVACY